MTLGTLGEYRVGIAFNHSGDKNVADIKRITAALIDICSEYMDRTENPEAKRLMALAMTHYEDAAMWAVKAVTKQARIE